MTVEIAHGRRRGRRSRLVLGRDVPYRFIRRSLDVRSGYLRLLTGGSYLKIPVRPPFAIGQCHVVRTPADAGAAQTAVVVASVETAGALMVSGFAVATTAATATAITASAAGTAGASILMATTGCCRRRRRRRLMILLLMAVIVHITSIITNATAVY